MIVARRTLAQTVSRDGLGLQFGAEVRARLHPSRDGIVFRCGSHRVVAHPSNITETDSCTRLGEISTIEHVMSALAGCEITDVEVEFSAPEAPSLDGAARGWVEAILEAGSESLGEREFQGPFARIFRHDEDRQEKIAIGLGTGHWKYVFHSSQKYPFDQVFETADVVGDFAEAIAPARTFGWASDKERIEKAGMAKGLREGEFVLLGERSSITELRFPDEPARHKLLDAIGDIYLSGVPIRNLNFVGEASGHRLNIDAAARLAAATRWLD